MKEKDLQSSMFTAAQHLNNMVNEQGLNVYVHCSSGISRAPAVVIVYLCLFKKIKCWQRVEDVAHFVKAFNNNISPNIRAIEKTIKANLYFQSQQREQNTFKVLGETIEESFYFPNMIIEESASAAVSKRPTPGSGAVTE